MKLRQIEAWSKPIRKENVSSFLAFVEKTKDAEVNAGNKSDFLFRGQCADERLIPKIARLKPNGEFLKIESLMLREFERLSLPFTEFEPKDDWDLLALAQHHGLPTRLLDWTYSALAALWFCVNEPPKKDKNGNDLDGVVWVFKTAVKDFINFPKDKSPISPFSQPRTRIFRPRPITQRILAQAGTFTCHLRTSEGKFISLESNIAYKDRLIKIIIPASSFSKIRTQLDVCGVNNVSLYPDLDGLAGHLDYRYFAKVK